MGVKVTGLLDTEEMVMRIDTTAKRRVVKALIDKGKELQAMAIKMAPVDEGNLEEAIKLRPETAERARDEMGRFSRVEVEVYIDLDAPVPTRPGKKVGDYAYEIHEHLTPMGSLQLGPLSQQKQETNGGIAVGGGFLTRAVDAMDDKIDFALREALNEIF